MSHISAANSNGRILYPDIPPPSINAEYHPPPHSAPPALIPGEPMGKGNTSPRGLWFFKKSSHNRVGSRSSTSSKLGGAPLMERSLSEPNSPTEPNSASAFYEKAGARPNYISKALELLDSSTVRFAGHEDDLSKFYDRYHKLFANGQPINGKIVRRDTPKPNAQDVARLLVRDIEAKLEEMDREMEILESDDNSSSTKGSTFKRSPRKGARMIHGSTPELVSGAPLKPWFDPSTINPVVLDKVNKRRSVNPEGTWHGHTRTRSATLPRPLPDFAVHPARNLDIDRNQNTNLQPPSIIPRDDHDDLPKEDQDQTRAKEQDVVKDKEREREKDREKEKGKRDKTRDKPHDSDGDKRRERDTGLRRRERYRPRRENLPPRLNLPQIEYAQRGRQTSDPTTYTRAALRRGDSPESLPPAVYTLAEDVEVRSGPSSAATTRDSPTVGMPRVPTVVAYPGDEDEELAAVYGNNGVNGRGGPTALSPIAEANPPVGLITQGVNETKPRRRRRSRSLGHELDGRVSRSRPKSRSPKRDRARERERERPRDKEDREKEREKEKERDQEREREKERERERNRDREKEKERERDRERDKERDRQKDRDRDRDRDKAKDRDKDRDRDRGDTREREKDRSREKDRDREREKEKDKYGSTRPKHEGDGEREREQLDSGNRDNRDRDRDRDKNRDRNREREREEDRRKEKDKNKDRERERDRDRSKDHNGRSERDRLVNSSTPTAAPVVQIPPPPSPNMPGAFGPIPPGFIPPPTRSAPSPGLVPPPPHHAMLKFGVPMNGPLPPNPNSESRFMEILTSPAPPMPYDLPRPT